ncbi:hypothetical protein [Aeromonas caviae]|uniref:hypothetical protein n=1 Tax=Aeromonas TaxID=642 RepID=UPI00191F0927|nr:hypothetical protein [Aeromonas caviae]MBL0558147.1 hypothetical protein [Aeromonas caviae]
MKIQEQDQYHGPALMQIVEHPSFKALNKGSSRYGHYLVNADCHVFVRYSKAEGDSWSFTFTPEQLEPINNIVQSAADVYVCLACGEYSICLISQEQLESIIDLEATESQWVKASAPEGKSFRVSGSLGKLKGTIPHNAFPKKLFDE